MTEEERENIQCKLQKLRQEAFASMPQSKKADILKEASDNFIKALQEKGICHTQYVYLLFAMLESATVGDPYKFNVTMINFKKEDKSCQN